MKTQKYTLTHHVEDGIVILDNIEVYSQYRGKGIAKKAMQRFLKKFNARKIELHAYPQDEQTDIFKLVDFYKSFGFSVDCGSPLIGYQMSIN